MRFKNYFMQFKNETFEKIKCLSLHYLHYLISSLISTAAAISSSQNPMTSSNSIDNSSNQPVLSLDQMYKLYR